MPTIPQDTSVQEYFPATLGVNLYTSPVDLHEREAVKTKNLTYKRGMVKRGGSTKYNTAEVVASKKILGLHRFYYSTSKQLLAASDTTVKYSVSGTSWTNVKTGLTAGKQTYFSTWGALQKAIISNGTDAMHTWDGSSSATVSGGNVPALIIQTLPYQDRLLAIDLTNPGTLTWSASYDLTAANWIPASSTGVKPDSKLNGMVIHSTQSDAAGIEAKVLLAGDNGMYLFWGTDLRTPSTTGDYTINTVATTVGCVSPKTMVRTPKGTMWLGTDRMVYLLPFDSLTPIQVGWKIWSNKASVLSLESIPAADMENASAVYHDGYYKLSFTTVASGTNDKQYWLDVKRLYKDEDEFYGPWYGPMEGMAISAFTVQGGNGDLGELVGGEDSASGFVYNLNVSGVYADISTEIALEHHTYYHPLGSRFLQKQVTKTEHEMLDVLGDVILAFEDINQVLSNQETVGLSGTAIYWNDYFFGEQYWSNSQPTRVSGQFDPPILARRMALVFNHSTSDDSFEWYGSRVEAVQGNVIFEQ